MISLHDAKMSIVELPEPYTLLYRKSKTWFGWCSYTLNDGCIEQCAKWEDAFSGGCHGLLNRACYCCYDCSQKDHY